MTRYPHVYAPFSIRGVYFKNRLQQAPPGCFFAGDERGFVTDDFVARFRQYARGGVAICTVGNCTIDIRRAVTRTGSSSFRTPPASCLSSALRKCAPSTGPRAPWS